MNEIIDIASRRELFADGFLVEQFSGKAELRLHHPTAKELVLTHDAPWEGTGCGYHSIFRDGHIYRMYYKAWHIAVSPGKVETDTHPLFCCYAESDDGIHWRKPELGLHEFEGSTANNIVMVGDQIGETKIDAGHPAVFKDENPNAAPDALYKAFLATAKPRGVIPYKSPDGIHWTRMSDEPVVTDGAFDSQNLAFWDSERGEYRAYWRYFTGNTNSGNWKAKNHRAIRTATSPDFLNWNNQADLEYINSPSEQLYINQIKPYHRAPHLYVGFPARYIERGWSDSMRVLPELEAREWRAGATERYGMALSEGLFMASRDGVTFKRWNEGFLRPGIERPGTWNYGHQYIGWHLVETASEYSGAPNELSLYAVENYWSGGDSGRNGSALRRHALRLDGFVSLHAPMSGGEAVTKTLRFEGAKLELNLATSAAGSVRIEIQDENGKPLPGFALEDCAPIFGDTINRTVIWGENSDLSTLSSPPVKLRFVLEDADVFAFQFTA